jgi:hypothetical protein
MILLFLRLDIKANIAHLLLKIVLDRLAVLFGCIESYITITFATL